MIKVNGLVKKFGDFTALNGLSLSIESGSIYGLIGINGSGKTTLIKHLTGILRADAGEITFDGEDVYDNESIKMRTGFIPDELYFFSGYSLRGMSGYYKRLYADRWDGERFDDMLKDFGLPLGGKISKFSKGMQKQAAFMLVMSTHPDYLILDEPIDGLDPIMRKKLWSYILGDVADRGMTVLISSHNLRELEGICDSVGILNKGKIQFEGKLDDLKDEMKDMTLEEVFLYEMEEGGSRNE